MEDLKMKLKRIFCLFLGVSLLSACGNSNTMEVTSDMYQHSLLMGVITDINQTESEVTVEGEAKKVNMRVTQHSRIINQLEEEIHFEDLELGLEVSVSWVPNEEGDPKQVELEKLEFLEK